MRLFRKKIASLSNFNNFDKHGRVYEVVVHIGAPKTGSSALQYFLLRNRELLMKYGFFYPDHGFDRNGISGGHSSLGVALVEGNKAKALEQIQSYKKESDRLGLTLLLSAESLFEQWEGLSTILAGYRVRIVAFFRDPLSTILSSYNQLVKRHFATMTLEKYCDGIVELDSMALSGMLFKQWKSFFNPSDVHVFGYKSSSFDGGRLEEKFLNIIGVSKDNIEKFDYFKIHVNGSYTPSALELKRLMNTILDRDEITLNAEIDRCLQAYSDNCDERSKYLSGLVSEEIYRRLVGKFSETNLIMKNELLSGGDRELITCSLSSSYECLGQFLTTHKYSLKYVLGEALGGNDKIIAYIKGRVMCLLDVPHKQYFVIRLADILGLDVAPYLRFSPVFGKHQIDVLTSEKSKIPDFLREIAVVLENTGKEKEAFQVISRARSLRPNGPAIIDIFDRIEATLSEIGK